MLASERAYQYVKNLKQTDPTQYNTMKSNLDEAVITIRRVFRDNTITKSSVELFFTDEQDYENRKRILTESLNEVNAKINEFQAKRDEIAKSLSTIDFMFGHKQSLAEKEALIREGMRRTHELKAQQVLEARRLLEQQKKIVAEKFGEETAETFEKQQSEKPVTKHKKKVVIENGSD